MECFLELSAARSKTQASPDTALQALGLPQEQYGYDPVGNRTSSAHQPGFWRYNADNQLTEYPSLKPFSLGALPVDTDVSYTPHGHTQKETNRLGTKEYGYNAAERLIRFSNTLAGQDTADVQANYRYDPFGRRIAKTVTQGSQTGTVWFIYSEQGLMAEASAEGELTKAYGFNPTTGQQGMWSTDPVWQANITNNQLDHEHTAYHYLHTDHLYTPMLATDETGDISWKAIQEAFGAVSVQQHQSRINMNLRFPGQYYDQETGTHYNYHRDYKPNTGRYVQSDPIGLVGGVNLYVYVNGNSLSNIDVKGLLSFPPPVPVNCWLVELSRRIKEEVNDHDTAEFVYFERTYYYPKPEFGRKGKKRRIDITLVLESLTVTKYGVYRIHDRVTSTWGSGYMVCDDGEDECGERIYSKVPYPTWLISRVEDPNNGMMKLVHIRTEYD